jgi:uncharacterized protein
VEIGRCSVHGMPTPLDLLGMSSYVLLTTFRRNGTPVPTAVWVVRIGDELVVWTNPAAGKVKRIRRDHHVQICPCSRRAEPRGRSIPGRARILEPAELAQVMPALIAKYGWQARLTRLPNRFNAVIGRPAYPVGGLAITLGD